MSCADVRSAWIQFFQNILVNGFGTFLPSILHAMGYGTLASNYLTIPVYVLGAIGFFTFAYFSDRYSKCGWVSVMHPQPSDFALTSCVVPALDQCPRRDRLHSIACGKEQRREVLCVLRLHDCCLQRDWPQPRMDRSQRLAAVSSRDCSWYNVDDRQCSRRGVWPALP